MSQHKQFDTPQSSAGLEMDSSNHAQGARETLLSKYLPCLVRQTQKLPHRSEFGETWRQFLSTANWAPALQNTTVKSLSSSLGGYKQVQFEEEGIVCVLVAKTDEYFIEKQELVLRNTSKIRAGISLLKAENQWF